MTVMMSIVLTVQCGKAFYTEHDEILSEMLLSSAYVDENSPSNDILETS